MWVRGCAPGSWVLMLQSFMQVVRWLPRAGFLLLSLLFFGPETAGGINPDSLEMILNYVNWNGGVAPLQYSFAVALRHRTCRDPQRLKKYLPEWQLANMKSSLSHAAGLYNPRRGNIVAARPRHVVTPRGNYTEHSEWRLLSGRRSLVSQLKNRAYGHRSCLILFTFNSPCSTKCLREAGRSNIVQMTSNAFSAIDNNYKAFVFQKIFDYDMDNGSRQDLLQAWHRLRDVPLLRCDNNGCQDCAGDDTPNRPNPCLAGKR